MSELREIHQWLYNKIVMVEKIEEEIVQWADSQGLPASEWMEEIVNQYGKPTGAKPLKKVIDKSNIHVWLYERVGSTEFRQAALITKILKERPQLKSGIAEIFSRHGEASAREYKGVVLGTPEELYIILNDYVLEGMPNERVNDILSGSDNVIIWRTTTCLHTPYWNEVSGDVENFRDLREAWVKGFVETLVPAFSYERRPNGDHKIVRK